MGLTGVATGASLGMLLKAATNTMRLVPMRREPWEYVLFAGIGGYVASQVPRWEQQMFNDINEMRADRHMPPMVSAPSFGVGTPKTDDKEA